MYCNVIFMYYLRCIIVIIVTHNLFDVTFVCCAYPVLFVDEMFHTDPIAVYTCAYHTAP